MLENIVLFSCAVVCVATSLFVIWATMRADGGALGLNVPQPKPSTPLPVPVADTRTPAWAGRLRHHGYAVIELLHAQFMTTAAHDGEAVILSATHPEKTCTVCGNHAIRTLGELPHGEGERLVEWIGWSCGTCGTVDALRAGANGWLGQLMCSGGNMLDVLTLLDYQRSEGREGDEKTLALLLAHEARLADRIARSFAHREKIARRAVPVAKVLQFRRTMRARKKDDKF